MKTATGTAIAGFRLQIEPTLRLRIENICKLVEFGAEQFANTQLWIIPVLSKLYREKLAFEILRRILFITRKKIDCWGNPRKSGLEGHGCCIK